jgi:anti-sigma factor RsiW
MKCAEIHKRLKSYLDGQLPGHEAEEIRQHISDCQSCSREAALLSRTWELLLELPDAPAAPDLVPATLSHLQAESQESLFDKIFRRFIALPVPAAATAALIVGLFIGAQLGTVISDMNVDIKDAEDPLYLDIFHELPSQTIGNAYIALNYPQEDEDL